MGWSIGYDERWKRDIGYGVPAWCDHPDCNEVIDRGLSYVCGEQPYGGDAGCGLYFCGEHLVFSDHAEARVCARCCQGDPEAFEPKPDHSDWTNHKASHPSWAAWRAEQSQTERRSSMSETIIPTMIRSEQVEPPRPTKRFLARYFHNGSWYGVSVYAATFLEA